MGCGTREWTARPDRLWGFTPRNDQLWQDLYSRGVLTGHVADEVQRWHFLLDGGETVSLLISDGDTPQRILERFDEVLACRLTAEIELGFAR